MYYIYICMRARRENSRAIFQPHQVSGARVNARHFLPMNCFSHIHSKQCIRAPLAASAHSNELELRLEARASTTIIYIYICDSCVSIYMNTYVVSDASGAYTAACVSALLIMHHLNPLKARLTSSAQLFRAMTRAYRSARH